MAVTPLILSLETATPGGSVFLGRGDKQLATRTGNPEVSHSNSLLSDINECLKQAGLMLKDVDLFACASGPGSFTGLRIGIATLKALAATLERSCVGIPTLEAVAHAAGPSHRTVALLPAGRGEVFAQMFSVSDDDVVTELDSAAHLSPQRLLEKYGRLRKLTWAGSGAHLQRELLQSYAQQHGIAFTESPDEGISSTQPGWNLAAQDANLAKHVAALALQVFRRGELQSADSLTAIYVRPSDAELKEQCR
jgi:tRNA threonylcarbamoyladenosine biosynthesis protein TsaB